jgi:hypothetical protein
LFVLFEPIEDDVIFGLIQFFQKKTGILISDFVKKAINQVKANQIEMQEVGASKTTAVT